MIVGSIGSGNEKEDDSGGPTRLDANSPMRSKRSNFSSGNCNLMIMALTQLFICKVTGAVVIGMMQSPIVPIPLIGVLPGAIQTVRQEKYVTLALTACLEMIFIRLNHLHRHLQQHQQKVHWCMILSRTRVSVEQAGKMHKISAKSHDTVQREGIQNVNLA